jgi:hypothetical protein
MLISMVIFLLVEIKLKWLKIIYCCLILVYWTVVKWSEINFKFKKTTKSDDHDLEKYHFTVVIQSSEHIIQ